MTPTTCVRLFALVAAAGGLLAAGCTLPDPTLPRRRDNLRAIGLAYHSLHDAAIKAPAGPNDLAPYLQDSPEAAQALRSGEVVFLYGVSLQDIIRSGAATSQTVIAYEKDVPTWGGLVLFADAAVQKLKPHEFRNAKLAKPPDK